MPTAMTPSFHGRLDDAQRTASSTTQDVVWITPTRCQTHIGKSLQDATKCTWYLARLQPRHPFPRSAALQVGTRLQSVSGQTTLFCFAPPDDRGHADVAQSTKAKAWPSNGAQAKEFSFWMNSRVRIPTPPATGIPVVAKRLDFL